MTVTHAHYIGITTPRCSLTYGVSPCKAQLSTRTDGSTPNAVWPNSAFARRAAGLTGGSDSGVGLLSFWYFAFDNLTGNRTVFAGETALSGGTARVSVRFVGNQLRIVGVNGSGTTVLDIRASSMPVDKWTHVLASWDLGTSGRRSIYVDDVLNVSQTTFTVGGSIDWTLSDWSFGALANGTEVFTDNCSYADFWCNRGGTYLDLSTTANRRLFYSSDNRPVYLGANGNAPTGSQPLIFFANRVEDDWSLNLGTGGGFGTKVDSGDENNTDFGTGQFKCFNTITTCQDPQDYAEDDPLQVMYFAEDVNVDIVSRFLDPDTPVFPFIKSIDFDSAIVSLGDNMGQRGQVTVTMRDAPHNDLPSSLFDKYADERDYDPYTFGTFWGKFRARNRFIRFQSLYLFTVQKNIVGVDDEGSIEMREYVIDSVTGPDQNGEFKVVAKDILKVVDGDYITAPYKYAGYLAADITDTDTTATMAPSGIISTYTGSNLLVIGGNEIVTWSVASGDNINITRGQFGTTATAHSAQDRLQIPYAAEPASPDTIIANLLRDYGGIDGALIDDAAWAAECAANLGTLYSMMITEPTAIHDLVSELIEEIGGAIWWDDVNQQIRLQILRAIPADAARFNEDNTIAKSFSVTEQESKRVTEVTVYYAQLNPTLKRDETRNYASMFTVTDDATELLVGGKSIKTIYARGIGSGGQAVAQRLAHKYLSRYVEPPRRFNFELLKYSGVNPALGGGYLLGGDDLVNPHNLLYEGTNQQGMWPLQDEFGNRVEVPIQVTRVDPVGATIKVEAEEMLFTAFGDDIDPTNHTIIFDVSRNYVNLQDVHDAIYQEALSGDTVNCYINAGVIIGSADSVTPAFIVGFFNSGVTVNIYVLGRIQGHGGDGAPAVKFNNPDPGEAGGPALYTRQAINLDYSAGQIWGGGGGGGASMNVLGSTVLSAGGGGGAGTTGGAGGRSATGATYPFPGNGGSSEAGGSKTQGFAGNGGNPGLAGQNASGGNAGNSNGGAAGNAIDGNAFITVLAAGDLKGGVI